MPKYRLRNAVEAVQYTGQDLKDLPAFVQNFSAYSPNNGQSKVGTTITGLLMVPHSGGYYNAQPVGDWLAFEDGKLIVLTDAKFKARYEVIPESLPDTVSAIAQVGSPLADAMKTLEPCGPAPSVPLTPEQEGAMEDHIDAALRASGFTPPPGSTAGAPDVKPTSTAGAPDVKPTSTAGAPDVKPTSTAGDVGAS